jgi:hypothetical protein
MPEPDEGDQLRREFRRQAPAFDLQATLGGKVSALVRRRQRMRRMMAVAAGAVVVAAVAVPLSALRSTPVGHGITPATTPATSPATTAPITAATTAPAPAEVYPPVACDTLDLWNTPGGTAVTTTTTSDDVTATLTGTAATAPYHDPSLSDPQLSVTVGTHQYSETVAVPAQVNTVVPWSLTPVPANNAAPNSDALCLARFPGQSLPTLLLGLDTDGAHCCTVVRAIALSSAGLAAPVDDNVGNPAAAVEADGVDAMIVTADNTFAYQFASFADSGLPIEVLQFNGGRFVDITARRLDLVTADATMWMNAFNTNVGSGRGLGELAPWVADECVLGQSTSAWATVNQFLAEGKLAGAPGWPTGAAYIQALKTLLAKQGYC